jgi:putative hemolysin
MIEDRQGMDKENFKKFEIIFADTQDLLDKIKYLRGRVFFGKEEKEQDEFDSYCHHLAVIDKEKNVMVGSYRLLLGSDARKHKGFYSESEFDITNIKQNCKGELLEMSRACVLNEYRRYPILKFMWNRILTFIAEKKVNYIFGCPSIENPSRDYVGKVFYLFKENCFAEEKFFVHPHKTKIYNFSEPPKGTDIQQIYRELPSLMKGYLKMGALVCSAPAWDEVFNTADFFMLLDVNTINKSYRRRFQ